MTPPASGGVELFDRAPHSDGLAYIDCLLADLEEVVEAEEPFRAAVCERFEYAMVRSFPGADLAIADICLAGEEPSMSAWLWRFGFTEREHIATYSETETTAFRNAIAEAMASDWRNGQCLYDPLAIEGGIESIEFIQGTRRVHLDGIVAHDPNFPELCRIIGLLGLPTGYQGKHPKRPPSARKRRNRRMQI